MVEADADAVVAAGSEVAAAFWDRTPVLVMPSGCASAVAVVASDVADGHLVAVAREVAVGDAVVLDAASVAVAASDIVEIQAVGHVAERAVADHESRC